MMGIKDWVVTQLVSKSLSVARPLSGSDSFLDDEPVTDEDDSQAQASNSDLVPSSVSPSDSSTTGEEQYDREEHQDHLEDSQLHFATEEKTSDLLEKIERLQIKFFRALQRINQSPNNLMVAKVLHRMHVATLIQAKESDLRKANYMNINRAKEIAAEQEEKGRPELNFSFRILVLGKTGVGKSSTINSLFDQAKTTTDPFRPATKRVEEIFGTTVNGIKVSVIDTPGLLPFSPSTVRKNRKILLSIKKFIKKSPPDMVLYFERLDLINNGYSDVPLLKLITQVFGTGIWFNTILVMTHCSSFLPEGPTGYPVSFEPFVDWCTDLIQHYIQEVSYSKLENPVLLVENRPHCNILPNGQIWKSQFVLLCLCTKILSDLNTLLEFQESISLGPLTSKRSASLPHLLSSFLSHHISSSTEADKVLDEIQLSDFDDEDEYDQLPPIRILSKTRFRKLTKSQKEAYLDELDYREILFLKKQLKEEAIKSREKKNLLETDDTSDGQEDSPDAMVLPDMSLPPSFDPNSPIHRYRCLVTSDQWLTRPVVDPNGMDHDVGFDGINLETSKEIKKNLYALARGQMSKDKQDFSIQSECAASFLDPRGTTYSLGLDVQSSGQDLICTLHNTTKLKKIGQNIQNIPECGVSVTSFGKEYYVGAKIEDSILVGKRLKFVVNGGKILAASGKTATGANFETILKGQDYPVRNDKLSLVMTVLSCGKDTVFGGNLQSEFRVNRGTRMSINASLNSKSMGRISLKTSNSEHMEIALAVVVASVFRGLLRRKSTDE